MTENILQLREYHINRGKNKSSAPIYPLVKPEGIIGLEDYLESKNIGGGVTKVTTLPSTGEEGKIYYNTTDKEYYVYSSSEFTPLGTKGMPIVDAEYVVSGSTHVYNLEPNKFYYINETYDSSAQAPIRINCIGTEHSNFTRCYVWRMVKLNLSPIEISNVTIPDSTKEIIDNFEDGHVYEFNVFEDVLLITDVTATV